MAVRVMHLLYSLRMGGMELGVLKIVNGADPSLIESSVVSCSPSEVPPSMRSRRVKFFEFNRRQGNDPKLVVWLYNLIRRERPDVLHTHAWGTLCEGVIAGKLAGVPSIVHGEHGTMELRPRNLWVQRRVWGFVDRVLSVSSQLAERMTRETGFPREMITVIRNGVDLSRFGAIDRQAARRRLAIAPDQFVVGTVGRLVAVKDQHNLLEAVAALRSRGVPCVAVLAGDGPLHEELTQQATALGILNQVRFLGARNDVPEIMAALDVFALTSRSEGLSNTILEAMASALPVVATNVGGNSELVIAGETGMLIPAESPENTAAALGRLWSDPARRQAMARAARHRAETEFSLAGMIRNYEALYLSVAAREAATVRA